MREAITNIQAGRDPFDENDVTLLDLAEDVLSSISERGYADFLLCPTSWQPEFQWAYESSLRTGRGSKDFYEFGIAQTCIDRDLFQEFVEAAGKYIKHTMPDWETNEVARRVVGSMTQRTQFDRGGMRKCSSCHSLATSTWMSDAMWTECETKGIGYRCYKCIDAEKKSRAQAVSTILGSTLPEVIYDDHGRIKL